MKKVIALVLILVLCLSLVACGGTPEVEMADSYMSNDETVIATFRNEGNTTVTYVKGQLNLFGGSANSQSSIGVASFEWSGTCEKGKTFKVTAKVNNPKKGLAKSVNRIGSLISEIK